jgi:TolB protein
VRAVPCIALVSLLAACAPVSPSASPAPSVAPTAAPSARLGVHDLLSPGGAVAGSFAAVEESGEATRLTVTVPGSDPQPWGIYDQETCAPPQVDHDAPFQFADIEGGGRSELVETQAYLAFPANLVVLVFGPDGGSIAGCADLGPPAVAAASPGPTDDCGNADGSAGEGSSAGEIAFSKDSLSNSDIYVMAGDGSDVRRLTDALGVDMKPTWSPDGRWIAFRTSRDGQDEVYVMSSDGTCERNLTASPKDDRSPAWSPNGCAIAYDHFFDARLQDVATIPAAGGEPRRVTTRSGEYPSWSPDGLRIAFASARDGDYDLYIVSANGSHERQVADLPGYQMYPAWSPDGKWIAYESGPETIDGLQIHVMRPDGTDDRAVTHDSSTNRFPAWSPDGRLAWSASGTIVVAETLDAPPVALGPGQFPAWRPSGTNGQTC